MNKVSDYLLKNLSIHVHGRKEDNTVYLLSTLRKLFKNNEIIYCTFDSFDKTEKKILTSLKINFFSLKDVGDFKEFNVSNTNYLRHNYSCLKSLQKSKKKFSIKLRSDLLINESFYNDLIYCYDIYKKKNFVKPISIFDKKIKFKKIISHSINKKYSYLFVPDQILFSERKYLVNYFNYGTKSYFSLKLSDLNALPNRIYSNNIIYLSNEQIQILSFLKNIIVNKNILTDLIFDKNFNNYIFDEFFFLYNFKGLYLPHRIDTRYNFKRYLFEKYKAHDGTLSYFSKLIFKFIYKFKFFIIK